MTKGGIQTKEIDPKTMRSKRIQKMCIRDRLYTVRHQIAHVRAFLSKRGRMRFDELFAIHATRNEIIATFLALLELISAGEAGASQNQRYGAIEIVYKGKGKEEKA